jgi:hypothetical protein
MNRNKRTHGHIAHIGSSRSCGFWTVIKDSRNVPYFALARHFLSPEKPRIGWNVQFTALPPDKTLGPLRRATEIAILLGSRTRTKAEQIIVRRTSDGRLRICLGRGKKTRVLAELSLL